ncbi:sigma-54-dependent Fis family transcriptional regulator [Alphaproteobacteria bacterium]|nr:sigma-54-dependent Fis family transcriptional regulator [Alphaproteobacteria bacterium]
MNKHPQFSILLVDDDPAWMRSLQFMLLRTASINNVLACQDSRDVMTIMERHDVGLVLLDLTMPHVRGEELLARIRAEHPDVLVIVITGLNTADDAITCMKGGAFDYFVKTWGENRLTTGVSHAIQLIGLERERREINRRMLTRSLRHPEVFENIITMNAALTDIFLYIEAIACSPHPVLITGESGVGKELFARAVHASSIAARRASGGFVSVNMACLEGDMLEDTLFGHAKGAYTSALGARGGLVEQAQGGVLFLDEIGELSPQSQAKLLRFLQEGEYYPLGSDKHKKAATRVVLATNRDIIDRQKEGAFRQDLYYRLKTHHIHIPPLRERKEDISLLVRHFLQETERAFGRKAPEISSEVLLALTCYSYPGNVRELMAMLTHAAALGRERLNKEDFPVLSGEPAAADGPWEMERALLQMFMDFPSMPSFAQVKKIMTAAAMTKTAGNQTAAARLLGISQPALSKRVHGR